MRGTDTGVSEEVPVKMDLQIDRSFLSCQSGEILVQVTVEDSVMKNLTLRNIVKVCRGVYHGPEEALDREVDSIITDSRKAEAGALFVAIVGERVDAHKFIPDVMAKGALALFRREN